ncbi:N-alpha-acetyltransferase mak3 [Orobanche minor]
MRLRLLPHTFILNTRPAVTKQTGGHIGMEGGKADFKESEIEYVSYGGEHHLPLIMNLVDQELSEPYSIFTYRYFVYLWPHLSFLAFHKGKCVGTVVCKMGDHRHTFRGYIAMLVVLSSYRGRGIATELVTRSIKMMMESGCEEGEVTLEAEVTNKGALALYGRLGFIRAKRLFRYYLNGVDAFRLKLLFPRPELNYSESGISTADVTHRIGERMPPEENVVLQYS